MRAREAREKTGHAAPPARVDVLLWISALASPWVVLVYELTVYALVPHACRNETKLVMHVTSLGALTAVLLAIGGSVSGWRREGSRIPLGADHPREGSRRMLGALGVMLGALSTIAVLWQWLAVFLETPCKL